MINGERSIETMEIIIEKEMNPTKQKLKNEADEIQASGSGNNLQSNDLRKWIYIIMAVIILLLLLMYYLSRPKENEREAMVFNQPPKRELRFS